MSGDSQWDAEFSLSCSQCGGEDFQEVFPVPAARFRLYSQGRKPEPGRELLTSVYMCLQCGHLEWFVDQAEPPA